MNWILPLRLLYLKKKLKKSPIDLYYEMQKTDVWTENQYTNHQLERFRDLLSVVENNVGFYKNKFGETICDSFGLEDLQNSLPIVTRELLVTGKNEFINQNKNGYYVHATSGSTGIPLKVLVSNEAEAYRKASLFYFLDWWGIKPGERFVYLWGSMPHNTFKKKVSTFLKDKVQNRWLVNVFDLNENNISNTLRTIERFKPSYMRGYTSAFVELAYLIQKKNIIFKNTFCKVIIVTAETLMENDRELIESTFRCKVANEYGSSEIGIMGFECPHGSVHLNEYCNYIRTDERGQVYVTDLFNDVMPIINYKNKDRIEISKDKCSCGRSSKIIHQINGRLTDSVICSDGKHVSCFVLNFIIMKINKSDEYRDRIQQFRFIQKGNHLRTEIVMNDSYDLKINTLIKEQIRAQVCSDLDVTIEIVEKLSREKSGKLRFFVRED